MTVFTLSYSATLPKIPVAIIVSISTVVERIIRCIVQGGENPPSFLVQACFLGLDLERPQSIELGEG
jgi:hypothetical protein